MSPLVHIAIYIPHKIRIPGVLWEVYTRQGGLVSKRVWDISEDIFSKLLEHLSARTNASHGILEHAGAVC